MDPNQEPSTLGEVHCFRISYLNLANIAFYNVKRETFGAFAFVDIIISKLVSK